MKRNEAVELCLEQVGKEFVEQGRNPEVGFDCVGLIVYVAQSLGLKVEDLKGYSQMPSNGYFLKAIDNNLIKVKPDDVKVGDLVIFSMLSEFHHIAMITKIEPQMWICHAVSGTTNKVVTHEFGQYWKSKKHRFYRFKEIEE